MEKLTGFLRLMRPANIVTAVADILAGTAITGVFISGEEFLFDVFCLVAATIGLYGGGVVFNDVFDAELDRAERPERPIPSGLVEPLEAALLGSVLLLMGITAAFFVSLVSGAIAVTIAVAALVYDRWGKHHALAGPVNMGLCRALNLLLGISVVPALLGSYWYFGFVPLVYIAAITMVSRGEVHGGSKASLYGAALLYTLVISAILLLANINNHLVITLIPVIVWALMIYIPLKNAIDNPEGTMIGKAVKGGVIALIVMNAAWATAFGMFGVALIIMGLLPLSILLSRIFAVT